MKREGTQLDRGTQRLSRLAERGDKLSDHLNELIAGSNVLVALFALGVAINEAALTEQVTVEESALETLYALQFVRATMAERPEWAADTLAFARFLGNCLSTLAADESYRTNGLEVS